MSKVNNGTEKMKNFIDGLTTMEEVLNMYSYIEQKSEEIQIKSIRDKMAFDKKVVLRVLSEPNPETRRRVFELQSFPVVAISNEDFFYIKRNGKNQKKKFKQIVRFE